MKSSRKRKRNKRHSKKVSLKWDGISETTKDTMRSARRKYGSGLAK